MPDDLPNGSASVAGNGADPAAGSSDTTDYRSKYTGLNSAHSKLLDQVKEMNRKMAEQAADHETELANIRQQIKPATQREIDLKNQIDTLTTERDQFKVKATKFETDAQARTLINEKYKNLLEDWDDGILRERSGFADDASFEAYLTKAAAKKPASQTQVASPDAVPADGNSRRGETVLNEPRNTLLNEQRPAGLSLLGATPPVATVGKERTTKRSVQEIQKDLWDTDPRAPGGKEKYDNLTREMDQAL